MLAESVLHIYGIHQKFLPNILNFINEMSPKYPIIASQSDELHHFAANILKQSNNIHNVNMMRQ